MGVASITSTSSSVGGTDVSDGGSVGEGGTVGEGASVGEGIVVLVGVIVRIAVGKKNVGTDVRNWTCPGVGWSALVEV